MPLSIALRMIRVDSCSSRGTPMWYPPRPSMETFSPDRPSVRYVISPAAARASDFASEGIAPAPAMPSATLSRNSRRLFFSQFMTNLQKVC